MNSLVLSSDVLRCYCSLSWLLVDVCVVRCVSLTLFFDEENPTQSSFMNYYYYNNENSLLS